MIYKHLKKLSRQKQSNLCVGLDVVESHKRVERVCSLIEQTREHTICYKLNPAFYHGDSDQIKEIASYLNSQGLLWIYDGKLGDVPHTNTEYSKYVFGILNASAMTVNPYCGLDALSYLKAEGKGLFVLARTSNPNSSEIQMTAQETLINWCKKDEDLGLVVAGNSPETLNEMRKRLPTTWFLSPGIGAQGGKIRRPLMNTLYSVSRGVINSDDPHGEARGYAQSSYFDLRSMLEHEGLVKRGRFTLSSGQESDLYIDLRELTSHLDLFNYVVDEMCDLISDSSANIVGVASAGVPLASALGVRLNRAFGYVRSTPKEHGTRSLVEGGLSKETPLVVIDDVVSTGGSLVKAIEVLQKEGYVVKCALCVIDRGMGGRERLKTLGVELRSLLEMK